MKSSEISQVNFDSKSLNGLRGLACGVELHWGNCTVFPVLGTGDTLFKTEELFLINYPGLLTPDLGCIYYEYSKIMIKN